MKRFPTPPDMQPLSRKLPSKVKKAYRKKGIRARVVFQPTEAQAPQLSVEMPEDFKP